MTLACDIGAFQRGPAAIPRLTEAEARAMAASLARGLAAAQRRAQMHARPVGPADRGDQRLAPTVGGGVHALAVLDWTGP